MGLFFSRFRRKQTTNEILEDIDKEINRLKRNRKVNQDRQKQFVTSLLIYSIAAYVIAAVVFFCVYFPDTWQLRLIYSFPLLLFPILVWGLKKSLHWYFVNRISLNDTAVQDLRDRKNQILEDVMETETYKKAREILEKYDPEKLRKLEGIPDPVLSDMGTPGTVIQQRTFQMGEQTPMRMPGQPSPRPRPSSAMHGQNGSPYPSPPVSHQGMSVSPPAAGPLNQATVEGAYALPSRPPMPRSILPRERGTMDRLMDYLVGDGPENRYALICWQCFSHNGMALKEEFEYLSFRCCYCYTINMARKQRPTAPRLEFFAPPGLKGPKTSDSFTSSGESDSSDVDKDDAPSYGSDRFSSQPDSSVPKVISSINSQDIAAPIDCSPLPDHTTAAAAPIEVSKNLAEIKSGQLESDGPSSDNTDCNQSNSLEPDKGQKLQEPSGKEPNSDTSDGNGLQLYQPNDMGPDLDEPDGSDPKADETESKRLFTGDTEPICQPPAGQEALFSEVSSSPEQQVTQEL